MTRCVRLCIVGGLSWPVGVMCLDCALLGSPMVSWCSFVFDWVVLHFALFHCMYCVAKEGMHARRSHNAFAVGVWNRLELPMASGC